MHICLCNGKLYYIKDFRATPAFSDEIGGSDLWARAYYSTVHVYKVDFPQSSFVIFTATGIRLRFSGCLVASFSFPSGWKREPDLGSSSQLLRLVPRVASLPVWRLMKPGTWRSCWPTSWVGGDARSPKLGDGRRSPGPDCIVPRRIVVTAPLSRIRRGNLI